MRRRESEIIAREVGPYLHEPSTGIGNTGMRGEAGGAELGGDTGDVGTPRTLLGGSPGGTHGTTANPASSSVVTPSDRPLLRKGRRRGSGGTG